MSNRGTAGDFALLIVMAGMIAAWGIAGVLDVPNRTEAGVTINSQHIVTKLAPGGPAESVNMQVGDKVIRIAGTDVEDSANIVRLPRVAPGERRSYTIQRGEDFVRYRPEFRAYDLRARSLEYLSAIVGFAFLLIPLSACLTRPNGATRVLALMGMGLSLAFFDGPHIINYEIRAVGATVAELFLLLGIAAMLHFLMLFPDPRPILNRGWGKKLIYLPMLLIWLLIGWRILFTPPSDSIAAFVGQFFSGLGVLLYLLIGLFFMLRNYSRTDRAERQRLALNRMLWGTVAAIIPTVVARLVTIVSPDTPLPGQDYYFATLALVPMTWSSSAARASD